MIDRLNRLGTQLDAAERDRLLEDERRRIARELHDRVEQSFFAIGLAASAAVRGAADEAPERMVDALSQVSRLAADGAEHLRESIFALSRTDMDGRGLVPALWKLARSFQHRTRVEADLVVTGAPKVLPVSIAELHYAVAREALSNVERHAHASSVVLGLHVGRRNVTLTVQDDGVGASALVLKQVAKSAIHFGLRGVGERVREAGGTLRTQSSDEGGFIVRARLPLPERLNQ
jgi:signal transduction histidine kinase